MENHGTVFEDRFKIMVDRAKAMKAIWTEEEASYDGPFVKFDPIWSWPKPIQTPHPPILLGGETKYTLRAGRRLLRLLVPRQPARLSRSSGAHGRISPGRRRGRPRFRNPFHHPLRRRARHRPSQDLARKPAVDRALFALPSEGREVVLPLLDDLARFVAG